MIIGAFVVLYLIVELSTINKEAQSYWSWSQNIRASQNQTWQAMNVQGCYDPQVTIHSDEWEPFSKDTNTIFVCVFWYHTPFSMIIHFLCVYIGSNCIYAICICHATCDSTVGIV